MKNLTPFFGVPFEEIDMFIEAVEKVKLFVEHSSEILKIESEFIRVNWNMDVMCSKIIYLYQLDSL